MTREELKKHCQKQIENCEMWARHNGEEPRGKVYEEHKLILELLEQEPTTKNNLEVDCISRDKVKRYIQAHIHEIITESGEDKNGHTNSVLRSMIHGVNCMSPVTPQEPWIPCSERVPKEDGRYLVTVQNLTGYEYLDNNVFECEFFNTDWIFKGWKDNKVIAWMPLPKEYKAESEVLENENDD